MVFQADAREAIRRGVEKLAKAVVTTLGPRGRNAVIDKGWGAPTITKDGVSVAEEIQLGDPYEQMGAQLVKEVASKTSDVAGDGTTTATLLTNALFTRGLQAVTAGAAPVRINQALQDGCHAVIAALDKASKPVRGSQEIKQIATISANNDPTVGKLIADAMNRVGKDGVITVEDGQDVCETDAGDGGGDAVRPWVSSPRYFVTKIRERMEVDLGGSGRPHPRQARSPTMKDAPARSSRRWPS